MLRREFRAWRAWLPTPLERDTLLVPEWVAESVVQEVERFLKAQLPANFAERLAAKAHRLYPRHKHFRQVLNRPGNTGRNHLYMYMRHWTAGWLKRERSQLYKKLPWSYGQGCPLPVIAPGVPENYPEPKKLVTADCIKPQNQKDRTMKTTRIQTLLAALVGALALFDIVPPAKAAGNKPNIVHIVADDLGWKDVGFNGCADIKTPNIDALAAGGAKFTQFYVQPMCTPTRAALMTGRYPFRYGLQTIVIPGPAGYGLDTSEFLMPQCLKEAGYTTAIIGKWHLGHADTKYWPRQRGFDYQYGAMIGELDYYTHADAGVLDWFRNNKPVKEKGYTTQLLGNDAVKYINAQNANKPFYLYLAFNAPHTPYQAPKEYVDRYPTIADPTRRTYAGMVTCLDDEIGRVVAALDKKGLRDNTLILFHSDNGGTKNAMFAGQMADLSKTKIPCNNGPYRDGKGSLFEGGCRVAAFANWPRKIKPQTVDGIIHAVDIYPTLAALAGASTAKCRPLDGVNVWETIAEGKPSPRTEVIYNVEPFRGAVRQGDWKLVWRSLIPTSVDLYNIAADPYEQNNVAAAHPDKVAAMQERLNALGKESAKPLALIYVTSVGLAHGKPLLGSVDGKGAVMVESDGHSITDEGFGDREVGP